MSKVIYDREPSQAELEAQERAEGLAKLHAYFPIEGAERKLTLQERGILHFLLSGLYSNQENLQRIAVDYTVGFPYAYLCMFHPEVPAAMPAGVKPTAVMVGQGLRILGEDEQEAGRETLSNLWNFIESLYKASPLYPDLSGNTVTEIAEIIGEMRLELNVSKTELYAWWYEQLLAKY
jgi:hypothetical protein